MLLVMYLHQTKAVYNINSSKLNPNKLKMQNNVLITPSLLTNFNTHITGMPIHHIGPVKNFHQSFNKYNNKDNKYNMFGFPTGIPELGWRNAYIHNYSKNEIQPEDPFSGISTRNYLNNMDSVDNIYLK